MHFLDPSTYDGSVGNSESKYQYNVEGVYIINGQVHKADGNFINEFEYVNIGENLYIGNYPQDQDIRSLQKLGITAVINLKSQNDLAIRIINSLRLQKIYKQAGITEHVCTVSDLKKSKYASQLFEGSQLLNELLENQG